MSPAEPFTEAHLPETITESRPHHITTVTVHGEHGSIDMTIPADSLLMHHLPSILDLCGYSQDQIDDDSQEWVLSTPEYGVFSEYDTLNDIGISRGAILYTTARRSSARPPFVDGLLAADRSPMPRLPRAWRRGDLSRVVEWINLIAITLAACYAVGSDQSIPTGLIALGAAIVAILLGFAVPNGRQRVTCWAAPPAAGAGVWAITATVSNSAAAVLAGLGAAFLVVPILRLLRLGGPRIAVPTGFALSSACIGGAIAISQGVSSIALAAWCLVPLVAILALAPQISLVACGLVGLVKETEGSTPVERAKAERAIRQTHTVAEAIVVTSSVLSVLSAGHLLLSGVPVQGAFAILIAVELLLRSRGFHYAHLAAPPFVAGVLALAVASFAVPRWFGLTSATATVAAALALIAAVAVVASSSKVHLPEVQRARVDQALNTLDWLVTLALVPTLFLAQGVYELYWPSHS